MSSTTDRTRDGIDFYPTPESAIVPIVPVLKKIFPGGIHRALEPAAGDGAIIKAVGNRIDRINWTAVEIREECRYRLEEVNLVLIKDFLRLEPVPVNDLVITNPPFSKAMEFVQRSLECIHENGRVVMLLRLSFWESKLRASWLRDHHPDTYVLTRRPSFINGKTDSCAYAWFVWEKQRRTEGKIKLLADTQLTLCEE